MLVMNVGKIRCLDPGEQVMGERLVSSIAAFHDGEEKDKSCITWKMSLRGCNRCRSDLAAAHRN